MTQAAESLPTFSIRGGNADDIPFILDSWVTSNRPGNFGSDNGRSYYPAEKSRIRDLLLRLGMTIRVAHVPDTEDAILGYAVLEPSPTAAVLHYVFVKRDARRLGICRALVGDLVSTPIVEYAHRSQLRDETGAYVKLPVPSHWQYNPYRAFK